MKFFKLAKDGGPESHVTGFFLVEIKSLFSIVFLKFAKGTREAYHSHAFNAVTLWLKGLAWEHMLNGKSTRWLPGQFKYTSRKCFHKVEAIEDTYAISFRGPWTNIWREYLPELKRFVTLTHGRRVVG